MSNQKDNKGRKKKDMDCPTGLAHYGHVYYLDHKFHMLTNVNIVCRYLFILLSNFFLFNHLIAYYFIYKLRLNKD